MAGRRELGRFSVAPGTFGQGPDPRPLRNASPGDRPPETRSTRDRAGGQRPPRTGQRPPDVAHTLTGTSTAALGIPSLACWGGLVTSAGVWQRERTERGGGVILWGAQDATTPQTRSGRPGSGEYADRKTAQVSPRLGQRRLGPAGREMSL